MSTSNNNKTELIGSTDRGTFSAELSEEALAAVTPTYTSESIELAHANCDIDHKTLLRVALGERFKINGNIVNATYKTWLGNLTILVNNGYINPCMRQAFIERNQFYREEVEAINSAQNTADADLPVYFYPPWTI